MFGFYTEKRLLQEVLDLSEGYSTVYISERRQIRLGKIALTYRVRARTERKEFIGFGSTKREALEAVLEDMKKHLRLVYKISKD